VSDVLVDSSAWIDFFRGEPSAVARVDPLLGEARAAVTGPIYAEVVSGSPDRSGFDRLGRLLRSLGWLDAPQAAWQRVAELRFTLARQGVQAHLVDLVIAVTALEWGHLLLTRDRDFAAIGRVCPLDLEIF
jgi:predicted nucleic acid-binding protein